MCGCGCDDDCHHHDDACDCCDEELDFDLRPVSETQVACPGVDLIDMLIYDEDVNDATFQRLNLTAHLCEDEAGYETYTFDEINPEKFYLITFPEGTNLEEISLADAISLEEISEKCFNDLDVPEYEDPCDGNCEVCLQDCIGKQPID
jgi:hypothetical protein